MKRRSALGLLIVWMLGAAGCGGASNPQLLVSAAASLKRPFTLYGRSFARATARFSFAGSDALAAQIEQGAKPDVFASANTKLPERLYAEGLVERPAIFAANELVLAVPAGSVAVRSLRDLARPGLKLAIGTPSVPVGGYTRALLARLPAAERRAILANVRDVEPDAPGIVGKLSEGAVDAGLLYATDVAAAGGRIDALPIPASLEPVVAYAAAVVKGTRHHAIAQAFIDGLRYGEGRSDLRAAGFLPPR